MNDPDPADLRLVSQTTSDGVTTCELVLGEVTAALWAPDDAAPGTPLVLLTHGGGRHRHHRSMIGRARLLTDVG
ncbi:MAG: alpha/beta hydrolase, partial [Actinobacteria bacterium]|nr:alpha/beta hydrolase [Actinomycetota bacterium]